MTTVTRARGGGVLVVLARSEADLLRRLVGDVRDLLADPEADDPLAELIGMSDGPVEAPTDPVLARLLPDGYRDDAEAAAELRRYTEHSLRQTKSETAAKVLDSLPRRGGRVVLDPETAAAWLGAINDVRLALGTRLGVTEQTSDEVAMGQHDGDDPEAAAHQVYAWLSGVQDLLVRTVGDG